MRSVLVLFSILFLYVNDDALAKSNEKTPNESMPAPSASAPADASGATSVKYRAAKDLDFEELIIEGQNRRPELSVVTGDAQQGVNGLLRLRENFVDRTTADLGEEQP